MSSVQVQMQQTIIRNDGSSYQVLSDKTISSQKEVLDWEIIVAPTITEVIWDPIGWTGFPITAFKYLSIKAEGLTAGEFVNIEETVFEGDVNEELHSRKLVVGDTLVYFNKTAFSNHSPSDVYAGTIKQIDKLRAKNPQAVLTTDPVILRIVMLDDS